MSKVQLRRPFKRLTDGLGPIAAASEWGWWTLVPPLSRQAVEGSD